MDDAGIMGGAQAIQNFDDDARSNTKRDSLATLHHSAMPAAQGNAVKVFHCDKGLASGKSDIVDCNNIGMAYVACGYAFLDQALDGALTTKMRGVDEF